VAKKPKKVLKSRPLLQGLERGFSHARRRSRERRSTECIKSESFDWSARKRKFDLGIGERRQGGRGAVL